MYKLIITLIIVVGLLINNNIEAHKNIIPDEAIRLRVIANSNSFHDQHLKFRVRDELQKEVYLVLKDVKTINEARVIIEKYLVKFNDTIKKVLAEEKNSMRYILEYGIHYFPKKEYKGIVQEEGYYESLLVTLGEGKGNNWWCVLFPPLCLIEAEEATDVEYKFFVKEIIDEFFRR